MTQAKRDELALFGAALEYASREEQVAYVDGMCGADSVLRARVEALLDAHHQAGEFLHGPDSAGSVIDVLRLEGPGTIIGPFKLLEQIGEGGFGVVFMAEQHQPVRRKVAMKIIKPGMDTHQVVARFEAEQQALALMDHPNIAHVFDGGVTKSGRPYFVMELVRGVPITDFCDQHQLPVRDRLELFINVCKAVQHAHHKGIIHRDLKPNNILVTLHDDKAVVKVIDFGIAKAIGQQLTEKTLFTNFAQMIGTPNYMSPEQLQMSGLDVDTRSDIYSLGVLLYELLTGMTPLDSELLRTAGFDEIRRMIREDDPARPSARMSTLGQVGSTVSANRRSDPEQLSRLFRSELDWIVMKALEKDRNRRYETASDFAADVQRYLKYEQVQACPPSTSYRLRMFFRRYKGPVLAASLVMLALLGGIFGTTWGLIRATDAEANAVNEARQKETALAAAQKSEREATDQLFLALLNQARSGRLSRQMGQRLDSLAALEKAARIRPDDQLRDEAIAALALPDIRRGLSLHSVPGGVKGTVVDGAYQSYAQFESQGIITIRGIPDNEEIQRIKTNAQSIWELVLSPNGQYLALLDADHYALQLWRVADGKRLLDEELKPCLGIAFSPDSRQLAVAKDGWVVCIDLASGQETNRWRLPSRAYALAFHPRDRRLAVGYSNSNNASIYDSIRGTHLADLPVGSMNDQVVAWHPDGVRLAVAGSNPRIQIWDVATKRKLATLTGHVEHVRGLSFHPNKELLASRSWDGVLRLWDPATGRPLMQLPLPAVPQFSSTGQWLGFLWRGGEPTQLLEVTPSREYRTLVSSLGAGQGSYQDGDINPDGRLLAMGMDEGTPVWDLSSGRELAFLPGSRCVVFQPESRALLTCGENGLHRWSIQDSADAANALRLGPPAQIALPFVPHRAARSPDGRTLAIVSERAGAGLLMDLSPASNSSRHFTHPKASFVALSQDGRWAASSAWHSDAVQLRNARTGQFIHEWKLGPHSRVVFTPDSRALIICRGDAFTFWDVETLQPIRTLVRDVPHYPGHVAFSSDGKLMALEMAPAVIHLKEVATGRTVARLNDPHGDLAGWMAFTPDGTQLVVTAPYAKAIHIWDLRAIRERLKEMGLDWEWPAFRPAAPNAHAEFAKVEVLSGDPAKPVLTREQKVRQAIAKYRRDVETNPDDPEAYNSLAWTYLTAPLALRDVKAAVPLAEKAVNLSGGKVQFRNTLGFAYYRADLYQEAVAMLRPNLDRRDDLGLAFDLYFLAMSHQRLGEAMQARDYYDWAVRWTRTQPGLNAAYVEELATFRAEAEDVLGLKKGS